MAELRIRFARAKLGLPHARGYYCILLTLDLDHLFKDSSSAESLNMDQPLAR